MNGKKAKEFAKYILEKTAKGLEEVSKKEKDEIYSYSFFVYNHEDDLRRPTITLGYNTIQKFNSEIENATEEREAKWNYAFWLQNNIVEIGTDNDEKGKNLIRDWFKELGLYYTDQEEASNFDACIKKGNEINNNFSGMLIWIVQQLQNLYELEIPILIHELEYYDVIAEQNIQANGIEKVKEFVNWINEM